MALPRPARRRRTDARAADDGSWTVARRCRATFRRRPRRPPGSLLRLRAEAETWPRWVRARARRRGPSAPQVRPSGAVGQARSWSSAAASDPRPPREGTTRAPDPTLGDPRAPPSRGRPDSPRLCQTGPRRPLPTAAEAGPRSSPTLPGSADPQHLVGL